MFQLDSIYGVSPDKDLQRSSGWPLNMHHLSARMKTQIPNNILFGFGPQGIVAFIADQQISRKCTIAQVFSRYFDKVSILGLLLHLILQKTSNKLAAD